MRKIFIILSLLFSLTITSANAVEVTVTAKITGLYVAYFNRAADQAGLEYWTTTADNVAKQGGDVSSVFKTLSEGFATHPTFTSTYGDLNNEEFVAAIYRNALGRDGDEEGIAYWTDLLDRGMSRSDMVATFVELSMVTDLTPVNYPSLSTEELAAAQLRQDLITNKVTVALAFTHQLGVLSNVVDSDNPESDPAYLASIKIISEVTEDVGTVSSLLGFLDGIRDHKTPIKYINEVGQINVVLPTENNFKITLKTTEKIAGYEIALQFSDDTPIKDNISTDNSFLDENGRTVSGLGPVIDEDNKLITFGAFSFGDADGVSGEFEVFTLKTKDAIGDITIVKSCIDKDANNISCDVTISK